MEKYYLLLTFILRHVRKTEHSLFQLLEQQYSFLSYAEMASILKTMEERPKKVCLLFDGFDEVRHYDSNIVDTITQADNKEIVCLTTTRPQGLIKIQEKYPLAFHAHVKLCGFNKEQIQEYIQRYFKHSKDATRSLIQHISDKKKWQLASIPIRLQMMCFVWKTYGRLGENTAELYKMLVNGLLTHKKTRDLLTHKETRDHRRQRSEGGELDKPSQNLLLYTAELANTWDNDGNLQILFSTQDIKNIAGDRLQDILEFGCVTKYSPTSIMDTILWNFSHLSLQEYFVAYHITNSKTQIFDEFLAKCSTVKSVERYALILECLANMAPIKANRLLTHIVKRLSNERDCNIMLHYLLKLMEGYSNVKFVNLPLPQIVTTGFTGPKSPLALPYLTELFEKDKKQHKNMVFLKIKKLNVTPSDVNVEQLSGLHITINTIREIQIAKKHISNLSDKAKEIEIQLLDKEATPRHMKEIVNQIPTSTLKVVSLTGPDIISVAPSVISKQPNLSSLTISDTKSSPNVNRQGIAELCKEANKAEGLKELNIGNCVLDENITSLKKSIKLSFTNRFAKLEEIDALQQKPVNIFLLDLSFSKFSKKSKDSGRVIGNLITHLQGLKILRLPACDITSAIITTMAEIIQKSDRHISLGELNLLANNIENCDDLHILNNCLPDLEVLLFTLEKDSVMPHELASSKLMATGTSSKIVTLPICETVSHLHELYMIYCLPDFSNTSTIDHIFGLHTVFILNAREQKGYNLFTELAHNLKFIQRLEELNITTTTDQERCINDMLELIKSLPQSVTSLNIYGYFCKPITCILQEKQHLKKLNTLNFGYAEMEEGDCQIIRQELQHLNAQMEIYSSEEESLTRLLYCSVYPPSELTIQSPDNAIALINMLA